jgi:hypothetical protein
MLYLEFPVGLPGSGKTTQYHKNSKYYLTYEYFDADHYNGTINDLITELNLEYNISSEKDMYIYVDGLFLDSKVHKKIVESCKKFNNDYKFRIFRGSIPDLIHNDKLRVQSGKREKTSHIIIQNRTLDTQYLLKNDLIQEVRQVSRYGFIYDTKVEMVENCYVSSKDSICSEKWSNGGTYGTCWDDDGPREVSAEPEGGFNKSDYEDLFKVLEFLYKKYSAELINLSSMEIGTFLYSKVHFYTHLAETSESEESDYYGGCQFYAHWHIDPSSLVKEYFQLNFGVSRDYDYSEIQIDFPEYFI